MPGRPSGAVSGDDGGEGSPVEGTSNPPPRSPCPAGGEMESRQRHAVGIDGVGRCLRVGVRDVVGAAVVITTIRTGISRFSRHCLGMPRFRLRRVT